MSARPEDFNATYRRGLIITVMDEIRRQFATGEEVTNTTLYKAIAQDKGVNRDKRLRQRVEACTLDLERSGHITRTLKHRSEDKIPVKIITPKKP